jgi:hypothetical protein
MFWLCVACAVLGLTVATLLVKIALLRKGIDEVRAEMEARLDTDTNTLISVSGGDRHLRRLAAGLNTQLRLLRKERRRLQNGCQPAPTHFPASDGRRRQPKHLPGRLPARLWRTSNRAGPPCCCSPATVYVSKGASKQRSVALE